MAMTDSMHGVIYEINDRFLPAELNLACEHERDGIYFYLWRNWNEPTLIYHAATRSDAREFVTGLFKTFAA
jgi:hypothetical protein